MKPESTSRPETPEGVPAITAEELRSQWANTTFEVKKEPDVSEGTKLILKRMESNPEEFDLNPTTKWGDIMSKVQNRVMLNNKSSYPYLSDYECNALWDKYCKVKRTEFHHQVMERLLTNDNPLKNPLVALGTGHFPSRVNITKAHTAQAYNPYQNVALSSPDLAVRLQETPEQKKEGLGELLKRRLEEMKSK